MKHDITTDLGKLYAMLENCGEWDTHPCKRNIGDSRSHHIPFLDPWRNDIDACCPIKLSSVPWNQTNGKQ